MRISHRAKYIPIALLLVLPACRAAERDKQTLPATQRARDSALGASALPGARGVRGALEVSDSAAARQGRLDSVSSEP